MMSYIHYCTWILGIFAFIDVIRGDTFSTSTAQIVLYDTDTASHDYNCANNGYITVTSAIYIKTDSNAVCPIDNCTQTRHSIDATLQVRSRCNGMECNIKSPNGLYGDPCFTYAKQLIVNFKCQTAQDLSSGGGTAVAATGTQQIEDWDEKTYHFFCINGNVMRVISAYYGTLGLSNCETSSSNITPRRMDVTSVIQENQCSTHSCYFRALDGNYGDPCMRAQKLLSVSFICEDQSGRLESAGQDITQINFSDTLRDTDTNWHYYYCPSGRFAKIVSAAYTKVPEVTHSCDTLDLTSLIQSRCFGGDCYIKSPNGNNGDPCKEIAKQLTVEFACSNVVGEPMPGQQIVPPPPHQWTITIPLTDRTQHRYYCPSGKSLRLATAMIVLNINCYQNYGVGQNCYNDECYFQVPPSFQFPGGGCSGTDYVIGVDCN